MFDPWQVVPRQIFIPYSLLLISTVFVVLSRIGCFGGSGVLVVKQHQWNTRVKKNFQLNLE